MGNDTKLADLCIAQLDGKVTFNTANAVEIYSRLADKGRLCLYVVSNKYKLEWYLEILHMFTTLGYLYKSFILCDNTNYVSRKVWGSWCSASSPLVLPLVDFIFIFYKNSWRRGKTGVDDIDRNDFVDWTKGVWRFERSSLNITMDTVVAEVVKRCIKLFSFVGDNIYLFNLDAYKNIVGELKRNLVV